MSKNNRYTLKHRRRREGKTNYHKRLALLKGRETRLVVRKTNAHTIVQFVDYEPDGDVVVAHAETGHLEAAGWKGSTGNMPAAYLAGLKAGALAKKAGVDSAVVDLGMQEPTHGGRLFAAVKGAIDAGIDIPVSEDALPADERVQGAHIDEALAKSFEQVKEKVA